MADASMSRPFEPPVLLLLGRVSNLPTVWTNVLAAAVLSGADLPSLDLALVLLAMTAFYCGGMYLNDAFDRRIDARERPERPIPSGRIAARAVFSIGFALLAVGMILLALFGLPAFLSGLALAATILLYDVYHKKNPLAPLVMGLCRALVYVGTAAALGSVNGPVLIGAVAVFAHVVGLTYAARQENLNEVGSLWPLAILAVPFVLAAAVPLSHWFTWFALFALFALAAANLIAVQTLRARARPGAVPAAVGGLIAAISLVDALFAASMAPAIAMICMAGYGLTRLLHRVVPGT